MYESNTPAEGFTVKAIEEPAKPSYEELEAQLASKTRQLQEVVGDRDHWFNTVMNARKQIEEVLAGAIDQADLAEAFEEPFNLLGVSMTRTVSIEINVTWRGTIDLPFGVEVDDLDIDDFGIDNPDHNEYETRDLNYGMHHYSIEER